MALALATRSPGRKPAPAARATRPRPGGARPGAPGRIALAAKPALGARSIAPIIQTKLELGRPNDAFEREADRVAEDVLRMPAATATIATPPHDAGKAAPPVQRLCSECEEELQRQPADDEEEELLQTKAASGDRPPPTPAVAASIDAVMAGGGQPLPQPIKTYFEPRFGHDFGQVRIHTSAAAARSARMINAKAYTAGRHIVFGEGQYAPQTRRGRTLLAHELTHTIQQSGRGKGVGPCAIAVASRRIQRDCGPAIRAPEPCLPLAGDIADFDPSDDRLYLFVRECDDLEAGEEARLQGNARRLVASGEGTIIVHGFASEEGDSAFNEALSCARANTAARVIADALGGTALSTIVLFQHGARPGERIPRRSVVVEWPAPEPPTPEPTPTPTPEPEPAPEPAGCPTWQEWLGSDRAALLADIVDCLCLGIKIVDLFDDVISKAPLVGSIVADDRVQAAISLADCLCGVFNFAQLAWDLGRDPGPCWHWSHYDGADLARLAAMAAAVGIDCGAGPLSRLLTSWIQEVTAELAAELFLAGGPEAAAAGLFLGFVIGGYLEESAQEALELVFDVGAEIAQNYITTGTPLPLNACRACTRLAGRVSAAVDLTFCDRWNAAIVPEALRIPEFHGPAGGAAAP